MCKLDTDKTTEVLEFKNFIWKNDLFKKINFKYGTFTVLTIQKTFEIDIPTESLFFS